jgi:hypothetical protein
VGRAGVALDVLEADVAKEDEHDHDDDDQHDPSEHGRIPQAVASPGATEGFGTLDGSLGTGACGAGVAESSDFSDPAERDLGTETAGDESGTGDRGAGSDSIAAPFGGETVGLSTGGVEVGFGSAFGSVGFVFFISAPTLLTKRSTPGHGV